MLVTDLAEALHVPTPTVARQEPAAVQMRTSCMAVGQFRLSLPVPHTATW